MPQVGLGLGLAVITGTEMVMVLTVDCRDFPVVQWLRLHTPSAGCQGSIPLRELDPTGHSKVLTCQD